MNTKPVFDPIPHTYTSDKAIYTPVTSFIHQFEPEKDWNEIAQKFIDKRTPQQIVEQISSKYNINIATVYEHFRDNGINPKSVQYFWKLEGDRANKEGSDFHNSQEELEIIEKGAIPDTVTDKIINLFELPDGIYTELMIWNDKYLICGKSDKVIIDSTVNGIRYIDIEDYKTNKELKINYNYLHYTTGEPVINEYMVSPISHLVNCNWNHYILQLSLYAYMLELKGFTVRNLTLLHTTNYKKEDLKPYKLPYMRNEIINMLNNGK